MRFFVIGIEQALPVVGMTMDEVLKRTSSALAEVMDNRVISNKQELDRVVAKEIAARLDIDRLAAWESASWYGSNQHLGEAVVSFALRILSLQGLICFAPRRGNEASFVLTEQWLGGLPSEVEQDAARSELVRRYLHCYGPSNPDQFAAWGGISHVQAARAWDMVVAELAEIVFGGKRNWLLKDDLSGLESPPIPSGIRLLPPHDAYLQMRDRATLIPDKSVQRKVWKTVGNPGVVLADGRFSGTWCARKHGKRLSVTVELFTHITKSTLSDIEVEAEMLLPFKQCSSVEVVFADPS